MRGLKVRSADSLHDWSVALLTHETAGGLRAYVDEQDLLLLPLSGGTMTGPLILAGDAVNSFAATPLGQVQTLISTAINALIGAAPGTLDTLEEIAATLNNDADVIGTILTGLTDKASLTAGAVFSGTITVPTVANGDNSTSAANTAWVLANTQAIDAGLTSFAALATTGLLVRTGAAAYESRAVTGTSGRVVVTDGDGVAGSPTIDLDVSGVTAGTYTKVVVDLYGRVTGTDTFVATDLPEVTPAAGTVFAGTPIDIVSALEGLQAAIAAAGGTADGAEDTWLGNGGQTEFLFTNITGSIAASRQNRVLVFVDGSRQPKSAFTINNTGITFTSAPSAGVEIDVVQID